MVPGEHAAHDPRQLLMILPFVVHHEAADVLRVVEVAHGAERDHHHTVVVVFAALHLVPVNADHLKGHAIDADALPQRRFARKKSPSRLVANHSHAGVLQLVLIAQPAAAGNAESANPLVHRIDAGHRQIGKGPRVVLDGCAILVENRRDAFDHGHFVADVIYVGQLQAYLAPCLRPARL